MCHVHIREVLQVVSRTVKLFREAFNQCDSPSSLSENAELQKVVVVIAGLQRRRLDCSLGIAGVIKILIFMKCACVFAEQC